MPESVLCPCKRVKCPRHGDCDACRAHHAGKRHPPACERCKREKKKPPVRP